MKIRKQIYDLTIGDIERFPVWEYALDEETEPSQDEATVRPVISQEVLNLDGGSAIIKAEFILADKSRVLGFIQTPSEANFEISEVSPVLITTKGQVVFWHGVIKPNDSEIKGYYQILGKNSKEVFPLNFSAGKNLLPSPIEGHIPGFLYLEKVEGKEIVREVR